MEHDTHRRRFSLAGRTALVTGSVRGLGLEIARAMAEADAHVILNGRNPEPLAEQVRTLAAAGLSVEAIALDVADHAAVRTWFDDLDPEVDILVNNAGMRLRRPMEQLPTEDFARLLDAGLTSAYGLSRALAPGMIARGGGAIINITSIAGPLGKPADAGYVATKAGLEGLTRTLATELGPRGVRCNAIAPGFFRTEANAAMAEEPETKRLIETRNPMRRWGEPSEIAGAAVFLASPAASYINGQVLTVDGGFSTSF